MPALTLTILDEAPGAAPARVAFTLALSTATLRAADLIRQRVEAEVAAYNAQRGEVFTGLVQPEGAERLLNGYRMRKVRQVDSAAQVQRALEAFAHNGFILLVDDRQVESLDEQLTLTSASHVTFLRLLPLVGG
jgi:hypothetical protein